MQNKTMIYVYARVSTAAQDESGQVKQLKAAGCEKVFREKITGTTAERPQLKKLMKALAPGDVVITPAVDRLSRDATDLLVIARDIQRAGAGLRSIAELVVDTTSDFAELVLAMLRRADDPAPHRGSMPFCTQPASLRVSPDHRAEVTRAAEASWIRRPPAFEKAATRPPQAEEFSKYHQEQTSC